MQPTGVRGSLSRFSTVQLIGLAILGLLAFTWIWYFVVAQNNNLVGMALIVLIPISAVAVVIGLLLILVK
jgi:hypothetical protein